MKLNSAAKYEFTKLLQNFQNIHMLSLQKNNVQNSQGNNTQNLPGNPSQNSPKNNSIQKIIKILKDMLDENQSEASFKEDLAFLQSLINSNAPNFIEAALVLGFWYKVGIDLSNICAEVAAKHAFELFQVAATAGNAIGQYQVGLFYMDGFGVTQDQSRANEFFQLAVDHGNSDALNDLGYSNEYGRGIVKDEKRATELYQLAVLQGHIHAINNLALCYERGRGVAKNEQSAFMYYSLAAELESDDARNALGYYFQNGIGVPKDDKRAFELFEQAANQGNLHAYNNLAFCYQEGRGVTKDEAFAFECYQYAANRGNETAHKNLIRCYLYGNGITEDTKIAVESFHHLENQGIRCLDELGICYRSGYGVKRDLKRMILLFQMCVEHNIGKTDVFQQLINDPTDTFYPILAEAVAYYKTLASENDDTSALTTLAFCYQMGLGCDRNLELAIQLYREALQKGEDCYWDLYICYFSRVDTPDTRKAIADFYKNDLISQAEKNPAASELLGYLFERGSLRIIGEEINLFTAVRYYKKSLPSGVSSLPSEVGEYPSKQDYASKKIRYYTPLLNNLKTACQCNLPKILSSDGISSIIAEYAFDCNYNKFSRI